MEIPHYPAHHVGPNLDSEVVKLVPRYLGRGVYALMASKIPRDNGGIVVGSRGALVIDPGINGQMAREIQQRVRGLTGRPMLYVVNTNYDTDGSLIWYCYDPSLPQADFAEPIKQFDNGNFLINYGSDVREVVLQGQIVRQVTLSQLNSSLASAGYGLQVATIHHDLLRLDNGHWILLVNEYRDFQDLPGYPRTTAVLGDALIDLDTNNQPVWVWQAFDHLDVNRHPYMFPDWTHSNGLVYEPDGSLLLSMRHQSWVLKIDYANGSGSGDVLWRLGPGGDFTLSSTDPAQWFYNQHYPNLLSVSGSTQKIALYDNGDTRPDSSGQPCSQDCYSRGVIMNIDESALTHKFHGSIRQVGIRSGEVALFPSEQQCRNQLNCTFRQLLQGG